MTEALGCADEHVYLVEEGTPTPEPQPDGRVLRLAR